VRPLLLCSLLLGWLLGWLPCSLLLG
jgi:hypothetical protein